MKRGSRASGAETEAFEEVFRANFDRVLSYLLARTDPDSARDAAANVFLVAWRRRDTVPEQPLPWLLGVARNMLREQRRSVARGLRVAGQPQRQPLDCDPADTVSERDVVLAAFALLSDDEREVLRLVAWDGLSTEQAAQVLGCSAGTFAVRLSRARRRLAEHMARHEPKHPNAQIPLEAQ